MSVKKALAAIICAFAALASCAQAKSANAAALGADIVALLQSVGKEVAPDLHLAALSAQSLDGETVKKLNLALECGFASSDGFGKALKAGATQWSFDESLPSIVQQATASRLSSIGADLANDRDSYAYQSYKFGVAVPLPMGFEIVADGLYLPKALCSWALDNYAPSYLSGLDLSYSSIALNVKGRRLLLKDEGLVPAVIAGVGLAYAGTDGWASTESLASAAGATIKTSSGGSVNASGSCAIGTSSFGGGVDLVVSKRLLCMAPYAKLSAYYCASEFRATPAITVSATSASGKSESYEVSEAVSVKSSGLAFLATGGIDLHFGAAMLCASATIEPASFSVAQASDGKTALNGISFSFGLGLGL